MIRHAPLFALFACASAAPSMPHVLQPDRLVLACEPSDAEVLVDRVPLGTCSDYAARGIHVGSGLHRIEVQKAGYWPYLAYYQPDGARAVVTVTLARREAAKEAGP